MQAAAVSSPGEKDKHLRVLLVGDRLVDHEAMVGVMEKTGYCVESVGNCRDVRAVLKDRDFDIVLMDIEPSEMDAREATAAIRNIEKVTGAHLPIIAVADNAPEQQRERYMQAGMDASVSRPIQSAELLQLIEALTASDQQTFGMAATKARLSAPVEDAALIKSLKLLVDIQAAIKAGDVNTVRQAADALKGCITSVLAKQALAAASTLEQTKHDDDLGRAQDACRRLRAAITSLNRAR